MICPPCRAAADFSSTLVRDFASEAVEGAVGHDPEICRDVDVQPAGCACQHRPVHAPQKPGEPRE